MTAVAAEQTHDVDPRQFMSLPTHSLAIESAYQRPRIKRLIARICREFDWHSFGVITVARDERGNYYIIDGQQRWEAARQLNLPMVPCIVSRGRSYAERCRSFTDMNENRVALTRLVIFNSAVLQEKPEAVALCEDVARAKLAIRDVEWPGFEPNRAKFACIEALKRVGKWNTPDGRVLPTALDAVRAVWEMDNKPDALHGDVLLGVGWVLRRFAGKVERRRLVQVAHELTSGELLASSRQRRAEGSKLPPYVLVGMTVVQQYDRGRGITSKLVPDLDLIYRTWNQYPEAK